LATGAKILLSAGIALSLAACRPDDPPGYVAGWAVLDPAQRHPILVSQEPSELNLRVARGAQGLTPQQRSQVVTFLNRFRSGDVGNSRLAMEVPAASPNDIAVAQAATDLRYLLRDYGVDDTRLAVRPYEAGGDARAPIRLSYSRFTAQAPVCGNWTQNLANDRSNLPHPDFGCATQHNFAAQVANPADLLGPRSMTPAVSERRDAAWDKFIKGESTITKKDGDEKISVKGGGS
jgi:pilus assembly protein CpaD